MELIDNFFYSGVMELGTTKNQTGDEPQTQDTQANMRTPPLRREVPNYMYIP